MSALVPAAFAAAAACLCLPFSFWLATLPLLAALAVSLTAFHRTRYTGWTVLVVTAGLLLALHSRSAARLQDLQAPPVQPEQICLLRARIARSANAAGDRWLADVDVLEVETEAMTLSAQFSATLVVPGNLAPGSTISAKVDGMNRDSAGRWRAAASTVEVLSSSRWGGARLSVYAAVLQGIRGSSGSGGPLLQALLLGDRESLGVRTEELYRRAGVSHVLALSGMHLGLLAAVIVTISRLIVGRRIAFVLGALAALGYTLFIGFRPSLVRATIMSELALILWFAGRPLRLVEILSGAFLIQLLVQPLAFFSVSFCLSYLALLGISVVSPLLLREIRPWVPLVVSGPLTAGVGAQVATSPLVLSVFGRFTPLGVLAGIVVGPLVALFMIAGITAVAISALNLPLLGYLTRVVLSALNDVIEAFIWWFAGAPQVVSGRILGPLTAVAAVLVCFGLLIERRRLMWTGRR